LNERHVLKVPGMNNPGLGSEGPMQGPMNAPDMNQGMNQEEPMDAPGLDVNGGGDDDGLEDILSKLSPNQRKAVKKYAEGIADEDDDDTQMDEDAMVTEITNNILDDGNGKDEDDKDQKVRNKKLNKSPFKTKSFRK
jgi:hypothetical protein